MAMEGYRAPILMFVQRVREEFLRAAGLKVSVQDFALEVLVGNQRDGDTRVLSARVRLSNGNVCERIELPDPEAADLERLKRCVGMALYRSWLVSVGGGEAVLERLPAWLAEGAVRRMDVETWPSDVDRVLLLWSRARLPTAQDLLAAENAAAAAEPALGAVLADYLMNRKVSANTAPPAASDAAGVRNAAAASDAAGVRNAAAASDAAGVRNAAAASVLDAFIRDTSKEQPWTVEQVATLVTGRSDLSALDMDLDLWFAALGRKVLVPGLTTEGMLRRFRANLLIYPADYGKFFDQRKPWMTFQELAASTDAEMRKAVAAHVLKLQMAVVGRDSTLLALADAYSQFLRAVATGKKPKEVNVLLMNAEAQRKGLEEALKGGKMIQDTF